MKHIKEDNRYYIDFSGNNKTIIDNEELYPVYEQGIDPIEDLCTEFNKLDARNKELEQENKYNEMVTGNTLTKYELYDLFGLKGFH